MSEVIIAVSESKFDALRERVQELMQQHQVPGVAVGLIVDGKEYMEGFGITSVENPLPVTPETLFQIGSTTKTVTATAMMRLVEQGALALDVPVRQYLPDFRVQDEATAAQVTIRHLLTHVAGWKGDVFTDTGWGDDAIARYVAQMAELPQVSPLGELWAYNNAALIVAGRVIEVLTGKPYAIAIRELVLEPLEMKESFFHPADVMVRRFAVGHMLREDRLVIARPWNIPHSNNPAGGLTSTVRDQLRYARFHMGDGTAPSGERVLQEATVRLMQTPVVDSGNGSQMALTWFIQEVGGVRFVYHGGATFGQMSMLWIAPERRCALTVLTNAERGGALHGAVTTWVREQFLGVAAPKPEPLDLPEAELAGYAGRYIQPGGGGWSLEVRGNRLMLRNVPGNELAKVLETKPQEAPPVAAALIGPGRLMVLEGPRTGAQGEFLTTSDGRRWLRMGLRAFPRQDA
jgi:CubicO group peptidase (beta-lactamase class C family)